MDGVTLADLRARRDALNEEIRLAELAARETWNAALDACGETLRAWLRVRSIEVNARERKNEETWDIGHGALVVTFGFDDGEHARGLRMVSGRTLTLEWSEVPEPERFLVIVAACLNRQS